MQRKRNPGFTYNNAPDSAALHPGYNDSIRSNNTVRVFRIFYGKTVLMFNDYALKPSMLNVNKRTPC